ncbi:TPA: 3-deoxy-manno-octulosonate cytidylyltransferase, partial [Candidatus Sumerlaeota bacterium]|nr:3-deoxy-manno-octulosonate cytidylyltransferase [Candidatus Sumerlaeota bacterium]
IPARYASTRFPGKPLADLLGKPLIAHVIERALEAKSVQGVLVATDDERIASAVEAHGKAKAVMTSPDCASGSDRIAEVVAKFPDADIIVNVQGDEPLMPAEVIDQAVAALVSDPNCAVSTAKIRITNEADFLSPNVVKVVCDLEGRALYFSRSPIPSLSRAPELRFQEEDKTYTAYPPTYKHFGLYVYRRDALLQFVKMPPTPLELLEKLEQLRFLENGYSIRVVETTLDSIGVDTLEDLERARQIMINYKR